MRLVCFSTVGILGAAVVASAQQTIATGRSWNDGATSEVLNRTVTVQFEKVSLREALTKIADVARVRMLYKGAVIDAITTPVSLRASQLPLGEAMSRVLAGTALQAAPMGRDVVVIEPVSDDRAVVGGDVTGTVIDATTKQPLRGAVVLLDGASSGVQTGNTGAFRIARVNGGAHRITVRLIGYKKQVTTVDVQDGQTTDVSVALDRSVNALDQVVVTGTVVPTEIKAVPSAITVITGKELEQRGITHIDQLFRGDVPGLFAMNTGVQEGFFNEVVMFSRGATALGYNSVGTTYNTNPIKTYVDGVELADPKYLSQIDPRSIERIEILSGPQASTIYGSNAINGVMQIFTKRGTTSTPQLTLNLQSGWIENNFSNAHTPQHDDNLQLTGMEGRLSYSAGGSWRYKGAWTPAAKTANTDGFGGARLELPTAVGRLMMDLTLRRSFGTAFSRGRTEQVYEAFDAVGWWSPYPAIVSPSTTQLSQQTLGLGVTYAPIAAWSNELKIGQDESKNETFYTARGFSQPGDSSLYDFVRGEDRRPIQYVSTVRVPIGSFVQTVVTVGTDLWQARNSYTSMYGAVTINGDNREYVTRYRDHNAGMFLQTQFGIADQLFLTYGVRSERNRAIGDKAKVLPGRYGVSYAREMGALTLKARGSYGRSIRPPGPLTKDGILSRNAGFPFLNVESVYGEFYTQRPNPELVPEYQQGMEGGLEMYLGSRGSLVITRYNQNVAGLIEKVDKVDSVRSLQPNPIINGQTCAQWIAFYAQYGSFSPVCSSQDANGYGYAIQSEYLNVGDIRNQGWELQGTLNVGPFATKGTYSWTKSRVGGITPKYRYLFPVQSYPQYQPGATFQYIAEHTWAFGVTYVGMGTTVGLNVTGNGQIRESENFFYLQYLSPAIRLDQNRRNVTFPLYSNMNQGYALTALTATHRVSSHVEGVLQIQNLLNDYHNDEVGRVPVMGRQSSVGLRLRF